VPDDILAVIVATSAATFAIRYGAVVLLRGHDLSPSLKKFLRNLPLAILTALILQWTFVKNGRLHWGMSDFYLPGLVVVFGLAVFTRSLTAVVLGGVALVALLTLLGAR